MEDQTPSNPTPNVFESLLNLLLKIQPLGCSQANREGIHEEGTSNQISPRTETGSSPSWESCNSRFGDSEVVPDLETENRISPGRQETGSSASWESCNSGFGDSEVVPDLETENRISPSRQETGSRASWESCNSGFGDSEVVPDLETENRISPSRQETGRRASWESCNSRFGDSEVVPELETPGQETGSRAMCFKCNNCKYANCLDKLKTDIAYIQLSLDTLSMFQRDFGKFLQPLEDLITGENNPTSEDEFSVLMTSSWFKELNNAVLQLKFQLPYTSYHEFKETVNSPIFQHQVNDPLANAGSSTPVSESVRSAYDSLRNPVKKKCLWCFSVFDGEVKKRVLINWWIGVIGKGLLRHSTDPNGMTLEQAGEEMLASLAELMPEYISRVKKKERLVDRWKMEPSVCSFLRSRAEEENFFDFKGESVDVKMLLLKSNTRIRHPVSVHPIETVFNIDKSIIADSEVETLGLMTSLKVLHLGRSHNTPKRNIRLNGLKLLKKHLRGLKHLRLLSLKGVSSIRELPESVCGLISLMVLDLSGCQALESLPPKIGNLKKLTHLDVSGCHLLGRMPNGIGSLAKLEVLKGFVIRLETCGLGGLRKLKKLYKLSIFVWRENFPQDRDLEDLSNIKRLVKLKILWKPSFSNSQQAVNQVTAELGQGDDNQPVDENVVQGAVNLHTQQNQANADSAQLPQAEENNADSAQLPQAEESNADSAQLPQAEDNNADSGQEEEAHDPIPRDLFRNIPAFGNGESRMRHRTVGNQTEGEVSEQVARTKFRNLEKLDLWCAPNKDLLASNMYPKLKKLYVRGRVNFNPRQQHGVDGTWQNVETLRLLYLPDLQINLEDFSELLLFPNLSYLQYKDPDRPDEEHDFWVKPIQPRVVEAEGISGHYPNVP